MLPQNPDTGAFWQAFCRHAGLEHDNYVVGSFGDSPEMATELADLVIAGIKRATASLARDYGEGRDLNGLLDRAGNVCCAVSVAQCLTRYNKKKSSASAIGKK